MQRRLTRHNQNREKATKGRGPYELVHSWEFSEKSTAMKFEKYLKPFKSNRYLSEFIEETKRGSSSIG